MPATRIRCALLLALAATPLAPMAASAAPYAPLDCAKAASPAETAICGSYVLGQAEARMATLYSIATALVAMGQRGTIGDAQHDWIKTRDACGADTACLARAYQERIEALSGVIDDVVSRGPF